MISRETAPVSTVYVTDARVVTVIASDRSWIIIFKRSCIVFRQRSVAIELRGLGASHTCSGKSAVGTRTPPRFALH